MPKVKRGRPKKKTSQPKPEGNMQPQSQQPQGEIIEPPKKESTGLIAEVKSLFSSNKESSPQMRILPAPENQAADSGNGSKTNSNFEETASRLEDKYAPGGSEVPKPPEPGPIPPEPPKIITDATVEKFLRSLFNGMVKVHGDHWEMSDLDYAVMTPVNTAMINEQVAKLEWFANSQNKALIVWTLVMGVMITSRSKSGGKLLEWLMEKLVSLGSRKESPTKTESQESPAS
jgi:hypothetical protein